MVFDPQATRFYLPPDEPIWLMSKVLSEQQEIEEGLGREVRIIHNVADLLAYGSDALRVSANGELTHKKTPYATLIVVTQHIPDEEFNKKDNWSQVIRAVNIMPHVKVYEISPSADDTSFANSIHVGTVRNFLVSTKEARRQTTVENLNPTDKSAKLLQSLNDDLLIERDNHAKARQKIADYEKQVEDLQAKISDLTSSIKNIYAPQKDEYTTKIDSLTKELNNVMIDLRNEREKSEQYNEAKNESDSKAISAGFEIKALTEKLRSVSNDIESYKFKIESKDREIAQLVNDKSKLVASTLDDEKVASILAENRDYASRLQTATEKYEQIQIELTTARLKNDELAGAISNATRSTASIEKYGRTQIIPSAKLQTARLIYLKVLDRLPYHRLAVKMLFDMYLQKYDNQASMIILKNDEGLDDILFGGIPVKGDPESVPPELHVFRLFPSPGMFNGLRRFEQYNKLIFFVDYIQSPEYYLTSTATSRYMTMLQTPDDAAKIPNFKGAILTANSPTSQNYLYDFGFDMSIASAAFKENRHNNLQAKVDSWFTKLEA